MKRLIGPVGAAAFAVLLPASVLAEAGPTVGGSAMVAPPFHGGHFTIIELHQSQRDLNDGDPRINMMIDSKDGRSWVLRYEPMPGSNETGYVWVEVPRKPPPKPGRRK